LKLLLDEMYTAAVAEQLRQRDHDVIAVAERTDLRGTPDEDLLAWAQTEDRALVTDNQRDFIPIHHSRIAVSGIATVSPEVSYSVGNAPGVIAINAQHTNCPPTTFEVDTYTPGTTTLATGYAFTIAIP